MMIAYLMASKRLSLYQAFQLCYSRRRVVWPNRSFMLQLIEFEKKLQVKGISVKGFRLRLQIKGEGLLSARAHRMRAEPSRPPHVRAHALPPPVVG